MMCVTTFFPSTGLDIEFLDSKSSGKELSMDAPKALREDWKAFDEWKSESSSLLLCCVASGTFIPRKPQTGMARNALEPLTD